MPRPPALPASRMEAGGALIVGKRSGDRRSGDRLGLFVVGVPP